ncbi:MAG: hypothetical protein AB7S57_04285 [Acetobacteraceae bacterium]
MAKLDGMGCVVQHRTVIADRHLDPASDPAAGDQHAAARRLAECTVQHIRQNIPVRARIGGGAEIGLNRDPDLHEMPGSDALPAVDHRAGLVLKVEDAAGFCRGRGRGL